MSSRTVPIDLTSAARSKSSSSRRTRQSLRGLSLGPGPQPPNHQSRSSLASAMVHEEEDELNTQEGPKLKIPPKASSRASMSSLSAANDGTTSSEYSTPGTSKAATPLTLVKHEVCSSAPQPRGRPRRADPLAPAALEALDRAQNLRTSEYALNPQRNKQKRYSTSDEEEEDDDDLENSLDAQLARTLQDEENLKAAGDMLMDEDFNELTSRRSRAQRSLRPILPKAGYLSELSDNEFGDPKVKFTSQKRKEATSQRSSQRTKRCKLSVSPSDESEFIASDDEVLAVDSGSESEIPLSLTTSARKRAHTQMPTPTTLAGPPNIAVSRRQPSSSVRGGYGRGPRARYGRGGSRLGSTALSTTASTAVSTPSMLTQDLAEESVDSDALLYYDGLSDMVSDDSDAAPARLEGLERSFVSWREQKAKRRAAQDRSRLESHHPELLTMWEDLKNLPEIKANRAEQPTNISRELKPFQLEGLSWMQAMEKTEWGGGLLGDEMGMGKTIQAVSLIMSDYPAKSPSLVLIPPVALMQWQQEIGDYTDGTLKTFVFHGTNKEVKGIKVATLKKYDVILMSYNSLEAMFRRQEKGVKRDDVLHKQDSVIHKIRFHRVILDEAHNIKTRTTGVAKACFALKADHKWCLSGTPLQNRIGEFFSLVRFLDIRPFACYFCKQCACSTLEWTMDADNRCTGCKHSGMQHVSVFNQELLNPIQKYGNKGAGKAAFANLRLLTDRFMLRRVKRDHSLSMELPAKEIHVDRQFFSEVENDFAGSIMNNNQRKFDTYVANGVLLNNYANVFGLIMQMRQVADHPDLILKKHGEGGQNILVCCICDDPAEDAIRSSCRHDFCRACAKNFLRSADEISVQPDCPQCHIPLSIDLEQPEIEQDEQLVKKSSIINRIKMEKWTSSTKIEMLVYKLHLLRSKNSTTKSIIFSQFTTMLQLVEWRLRRAGITTVMLDGSMTPAQRQGSINHFMQTVDCECFLVSLKAGGVALNLTEASHVFIVDPWWNPAAEWQSADRCHRIGQTRPCTITRLCIEDSVESRMVLLQEKKANMINSTINSDDAAMESLTPEDMQFLFRGN